MNTIMMVAIITTGEDAAVSEIPQLNNFAAPIVDRSRINALRCVTYYPYCVIMVSQPSEHKRIFALLGNLHRDEGLPKWLVVLTSQPPQ